MNHKEFTYWLEGFLAGKQDLDEAQITRIKEQLNSIEPGPRVQRVTHVPNPRRDIVFPNRIEPTCDTGKQLLKDQIVGKRDSGKFSGEF